MVFTFPPIIHISGRFLGNHVIHPVYISPGLPNEGHTPIIIMQGEEDNYSEKLETDNATNTIQIQENVDNVLHEESVRLNEAVLDSSRDNNDVRVEKEEECLVQEEFVPFENMDDEELLLGPWGEVLTGVPPPSTIGIDLQQLIEEDDRDEVITVLDAGYVTKGTCNTCTHYDYDLSLSFVSVVCFIKKKIIEYINFLITYVIT